MKSKGLRVLIVDDEADYAEALAEYLASRGIETRHQDSGAGLMESVAEFAPHIVVLDLRIGGESGLALADRLRFDPAVTEPPAILFLSGYASTVDRVVGLELGAEGFVDKTAPVREILARVRAIAARLGVPVPAARLDVLGGVAVDYDAQVLLGRDMQEIPLGPGEISLLRALVAHRGTVLSRAHLLELSPASDDDPDDRSMDGRIARLRRKLEQRAGGVPVIETVRGMGYRLLQEENAGRAGTAAHG